MRSLSTLFGIVLWIQTAPSGFSQDTRNFDQLLSTMPDDALIQVIQSVLQERIESYKNCLVQTEVLSFLQTSDGKISDVGRHFFEHKQLDNSYRINTDAYGSHSANTPQTISASAFSQRDGTATMFAEGVKDHHYGRIDNRHDPIITLNAYDIFLLQNPRHTSVSIIPYLLAYKNEWAIDKSEHIIKVKTPHRWGIGADRNEAGYYLCYLDSRKAFAPIYVEEEWGNARERKGNWRRVVTVVTEDKWIGKINMPFAFTRTATGSALGNESEAISEVKVSQIEFGKLTEDDIRLEFPVGTEVIDALKGTTFFVGQDGNRLQEVSLHQNFADFAAETAPRTSPWRSISIIANLIVVFLLLLMLRWKFRLKAAQIE